MGMRIWNFAVTIFFSTTILFGASSLARVPLSFEPAVRNSEFVAHAGAWNAVVTPTGAAIGKGWMRLVGASASAAAVPETLLPSYTNYLIGEHRREWRTHVANYSRVRYSNIYPGIDVVYYGKPGELEFDFLIAPGADPRRIRLALSSADLQIRLPRIYQGDRPIKGHTVRHRSHVTFEVDRYDRSRPLVIDPVLSFATMLGGGLNDGGVGIAVDASGATYVIGSTLSGNFPAVSAVQAHVNGFIGATHVFVSKINAAGTALVYSTYLGGSRLDFAGATAVDRAGAAYVTGQTNSPDFPVAGASPMQPTLGGDFDGLRSETQPRRIGAYVRQFHRRLWRR